MPVSSAHTKFLRIIDTCVEETEIEVAERGKKFSCAKGCSHCCHLYVETTWDEAIALAEWITDQPETQQARLRKKISLAAEERISFFAQRKSTKRYATPTRSWQDVPDRVNREYFYEKSRPCPLLENGTCTAYPARPSACRLHIVTSHPRLCSREVKDDFEMEIPAELDKKRPRIEAVAEKYLPDERWGELSIMLQHALEHLS